MPGRFELTQMPPETLAQNAQWFIFQGFNLLVYRNGSQSVKIPSLSTPEEIGLTEIKPIYLGYLSDAAEHIDCYGVEARPDFKPPEGMYFSNLRSLYPLLDEASFWLAGQAVQIVDWDRTHRFCGRCGHTTNNHPQERSKVCPQCGLTSYPRLAPAIIVRVSRQTERGEQILLARAQRFPAGMYSVLAGFVEPGETLEECVEREVREESGICVKNIRYFGSQPWPFPHSLMVAFTAEHNEGEINIDPNELVDAGWFSADELPSIPQPPSIANQLITNWVAEQTTG